MEYLHERIASANQAELVAIVYEGLIVKLKDSIENIEKNDDVNLNKNIIKSRDILAHLLATLEGHGEIAMNYRSLYIYLNKLITSAEISKDVKKLEQAIKIVSPMYEGWKELGEKIFKESVEKGNEDRIVSGMTYGKGHLKDDKSSSGNTFEA